MKKPLLTTLVAILLIMLLAGLIIPEISAIRTNEENIQRLFSNDKTAEENMKRLFENDTKSVDALNDLWKRFRLYTDQQTFTLKQTSKRPLDLRNKSFGTFDTGSGALYLAIEEVKPDKDGFILKAKVGNPSSITFTGVEISASWNPPDMTSFPTGEQVTTSQIEKWLDGVKKQWENMPTSKTTVNQPILPGVWTPVDLVVGPVKFSELDNVFFDVSIKSVLLPDKS